MANRNSINVDHPALATEVENQMHDALINGNRRARAVLSLLIMAMTNDCPPTDELVMDSLEGLEAILELA